MRFIILLIPVLLGCKPAALETLKLEIEKELSKNEGTFAVAFKDLQTGDTLFINAREPFHAASTMKTPVMIEVYKQAHEGVWSLTDSVEVKNEFKSIVDGSLYSLDSADDSERNLYKQVGKKRTVAGLTYDMIIASSNLATNLVIEYVDAKKVTQTMRELGANDIQVLRGVEDNKAYRQGLNNTTTAFDLMLIFEKLAKGEVVSKEACDDMIRILLDQQFKEIIPAKLPQDVKVAHKTGSISGVRHDSGIVFLPDGRKYVLVLLSKEMKNVDAGIESMAVASELVYKYVTDK
jgi:beta-lactamase class A